MERIEYKNVVDKSKWDRGPWDKEPDKIQWQDEATGLPCLIVRSHMGFLCGYVGVDNKHPLYSVNYSDSRQYRNKWSWRYWRWRFYSARAGVHYRNPSPESLFNVHGGLTFSAFCAPIEEVADHAKYICRVPGEGEPDKVWWFGFDCGHAYDLAPEMVKYHKEINNLPGAELLRKDTYRDVEYVTREVTNLAKQIHAYKT